VDVIERTSQEICNPDRLEVDTTEITIKSSRKKPSLRQMMELEKRREQERQKVAEKVHSEILMIGNCKIM
jgi:hypothetical protein